MIVWMPPWNWLVTSIVTLSFYSPVCIRTLAFEFHCYTLSAFYNHSHISLQRSLWLCRFTSILRWRFTSLDVILSFRFYIHSDHRGLGLLFGFTYLRSSWLLHFGLFLMLAFYIHSDIFSLHPFLHYFLHPLGHQWFTYILTVAFFTLPIILIMFYGCVVDKKLWIKYMWSLLPTIILCKRVCMRLVVFSCAMPD